jgi:chorismate dehydratase
MVFGKIDYINLLPFYVFLKRYIKSTALKKSIDYKKAPPSFINKEFRKRRVDAAFISSIESARLSKKRCLDIGIIAKKEVRSVLVLKGRQKDDPHSATSNALAKTLGIEGEVIIGDKALKKFLQNPDIYIDLAYEWHKRTKLPFVFARLCLNKNRDFYTVLTKNFLKREIKIPRYILKHYSLKKEIDAKEILEYLKLINYKMDHKSKKSLKLFLRSSKCKKTN